MLLRTHRAQQGPIPENDLVPNVHRRNSGLGLTSVPPARFLPLCAPQTSNTAAWGLESTQHLAHLAALHPLPAACLHSGRALAFLLSNGPSQAGAGSSADLAPQEVSKASPVPAAHPHCQP